MHFWKLHGLGNDYVYLDAWRYPLPVDLPAAARAMSDRHRGIGGDGLIVVAPPHDPSNHARMQMWNADGSESEMCGNGLRCAAHLAFRNGHVPATGLRFETGAGVLAVDLQLQDGRCIGASIDMGSPRLEPAAVPVEYDGPGPLMDLSFPEHHLHGFAVGMGNPHLVCFVDDADAYPVQTVGPQLERHAAFPRRTNIEFVHLLGTANGVPLLRQRTWERGSGETQACGTGACATAVAAILNGRITGEAAIIRLSGGDLHIQWAGPGRSVIMHGPSKLVFEGDWSG